MVRNRVAVALVIAGIALAMIEMNLPRAAAILYPPTPAPAAVRAPRDAIDVPVVWRDFRPGERDTGLGTTVRVCGAALERGVGKSALIVRFCEALPQTAERRFAFGFDDLVVRAQLPGGGTLAYDLVSVDASRDPASRATEGALVENTAPIASVRVSDVTDLIFAFSRELPLGLPSIDVSARFAGKDVHDSVSFAPLGADLAATEMARVATAPDWARTTY